MIYLAARTYVTYSIVPVIVFFVIMTICFFLRKRQQQQYIQQRQVAVSFGKIDLYEYSI